MSTFFAIKPPSAVSAALVDVANERARLLGGKPTRAQTIHLTLAFLGDFPSQRVSELIRVAQDARTVAFDLPIDHLGYWSHNRLLWAGSLSLPSGLMSLAKQLELALIDAGCMPRESSGRHPFTPHITLVRKVSEPVAASDLSMGDSQAWTCNDFVLVRSRRGEAVPDHEILARFALDQAV